MERSELKEAVSKIQAGYDMLKSFPTENHLKFRAYVLDKLVYRIDDKFYRLSAPEDYWKRHLLAEYFKANGCNIFAEEKIEKDLCFDDIIVTSQEPVTVYTGEDYMERFGVYCNRVSLQECIKKAGVCDFLHNNMGLTPGNKLVVFDCIANTSLNFENFGKRIILVNGMVEELYAIDIE